MQSEVDKFDSEYVQGPLTEVTVSRTVQKFPSDMTSAKSDDVSVSVAKDVQLYGTGKPRRVVIRGDVTSG
jgi:hypothetical protein